MITLTASQIADLARFAGFNVQAIGCECPHNDIEMLVTVAPCPAGGVIADDGRARHYGLVAYCAEYPEEGMIGLGPELTEGNP